MSMRLAAVLVASAGCVLAAQDPPTLRAVLARLDAYVTAYETTLSAVVAEERYLQTLDATSSPGRRTETRTLLSDYALARSPGGHVWTGLRDTYDVDGTPVRDRDQRLLALLAEGSGASSRQTLQILRDNARYNLGEEIVTRTINVPTIALDYLHPRNRSRLRTEKQDEETIAGVRVWVLSFRERERPTLLRTPDGRDRRAHVVARVDPRTGDVLRTDLSWEGAPAGFVIVHYRRDERLGALVPETMLEEYRAPRVLVTGKATYTNYRRFETGGRVIP